MLLSTRRGRFEKIVLPIFFIENDQGMYKNGVLANNRKSF